MPYPPSRLGRHYAGPVPETVSGVAQDSRLVVPGDAFFAVRSPVRSGEDYIPDAVKRGAVAVVTEGTLAETPYADKVGYYRAEDVRLAAAEGAAACYPDALRYKCAVTGTNGKTSVCWIMRALWRRLGISGMSVGTLGVLSDLGTDDEGGLTTPDAPSLHKTLTRLSAAGVTHAVMEASSHGIDQHRLAGCRFDAGMFTNLTQDHLDYHGTLEAYFAAKCRLFGLIREGGLFVLNADAQEAPALLTLAKEHGVRPVSVGTKEGADCRILSVAPERDGQRVRFSYRGAAREAYLSLQGAFQSRNALFVFCAMSDAFPGREGDMLEGFAHIPEVPGRMQYAPNPKGVRAFVDYAHTPDALEKSLIALREITKGRVIAVFGCGGDRDRTKRPVMGGIACRYADVAIVTDDNPRTEPPESIREQIYAGCDKAKTFVIGGGRREAIRAALDMAEEGDAVLVAGKGHESYQEIQGVRRHFSDAEEIAGYGGEG
jgi:UDP-N-acetylmuramoyl-L-alanyl-D-glutamate--2,6-diaminopimelate ligase